ncbi:MAG: sensor histidine kinase N-terminal domain-containing protein [Nitrosomonadales bacterium]|nr:sensor histidine kinase N-terminal domain-containing protein [Nitrosomonadales bacterium]
MSSHKFSLQTRLTLLVLGSVLLFGLLAGYESYKNAMYEADQLFDAQLAQYAQNLMVVATHSDNDDEAEAMPPHAHKYQQTLAFQVWNTNREYPRELLRSSNASGMISALQVAEGYSGGEWQGEHWRYYRQRDTQRGLDVLVGQSDRARNELAGEVAWHNIAPFLFGLPVLAVLAVLAVRFGLHPLRNLTDSLHSLSPEQLNPVTLRDAPQEIGPVVEALNKLLGRIARAMENERRFTADASHELRTPLAALQAQVQAAQLSTDDDERKECLAKALQGAERMAHLVGQLLTLSRLDEAAPQVDPKHVDLEELVRECCAELGADALARNIEIGFSSQTMAQIAGAPDMLRILLRNLLDNAIRYTPPGGRVEVKLCLADDAQTELEIADSGSGVSEEQLALLGQRFHRIAPGTTDGVGLGLSIVQRIAEIHHAALTFDRSTLGGLSVKLRFLH